jgi:hypothetical protein
MSSAAGTAAAPSSLLLRATPTVVANDHPHRESADGRTAHVGDDLRNSSSPAVGQCCLPPVGHARYESITSTGLTVVPAAESAKASLIPSNGYVLTNLSNGNLPAA